MSIRPIRRRTTLAVAAGLPLIVALAPSAGAEVPAPAPGVLAVVAGSGARGTPTAGPATSSALASPQGVAVDAAGDLFIADTDNQRIEEVTPTGTLSVIAGTGTAGTPTPGPATSSSLDNPHGLAVDAAGDLYIADTTNQRVEEVTPNGTLSVIAGTGNSGAPTAGLATGSDLYNPTGVAVDVLGDVLIADTGNERIERVTPTGTLSVFAGNGNNGTPTAGPATDSALYLPQGVAVNDAGTTYIADSGNSEVEEVTPTGTLSVIAGTGDAASPTPGPAASSPLGDPTAVAVDALGDVFIADLTAQRVEEVTPAGTLSVVAGTGHFGPSTSGPATSSQLAYPSSVAADAAGNFYVADTNNSEVDEVGGPATLATPPAAVPETGLPLVLAGLASVAALVVWRRRRA